jgi:hypothetical protein
MFPKNAYTKKISKQIKYDFNTNKNKYNRFKKNPQKTRKFKSILYDKSKFPKVSKTYKSDMYILNKNEFYKTRKQPKVCFIKNKKLLKKYKSFTPCSMNNPLKNFKEEEIINNAKSSNKIEHILNKNILDEDSREDSASINSLFKQQNKKLKQAKFNTIKLDNKKVLSNFYKKLESKESKENKDLFKRQFTMLLKDSTIKEPESYKSENESISSLPLLYSEFKEQDKLEISTVSHKNNFIKTKKKK